LADLKTAIAGTDLEAIKNALKISGGQKQRTALARCLIRDAEIYLLDEPIAHLDAKLRQKMRFELKRLQQELGITTVYVTHDQSEALALSHEIAVMDEGRIVQIGTPREIYERPRNRFVADFVGATNFLDATVLAADSGGGRCRVGTPLGELDVRCFDSLGRGEAVVISVRPEDVELSEAAPERAEGHNVFKGIVEFKAFLGEYLDFQVRVGGSLLLARAHPSLRTPVGGSIYVRMNREKCVAIPRAAARADAA
jgi:iron(III) transport system ATP-binding protein